MSTTQEEAGKIISGLVAKYQNLSDKERKDYTEADTRRNFVEPLFGALGWDIYNKAEVSEEEKASRGRVDYVFKLQGVSRFYLEAKALRIDLNKQEFTKQVTTYAYNKGTIWAVLSNFENLRVFNAQTGQGCLSLAYSDYLSKLDDLWLLSRELFEKNALDEWAETHGVLPPRLGIEQRLYEQLRLWREELFTQIHHYNEKLTFIQIDEVIQRFFNRLIFIRTSEDRQIENRVLLGAVHEWRSSGRKGELIQVLQRIFHEFDGYYDSDLFAPHLVDQVYIESTTVENIITGLYDIPRTVASYDFSVIDADVLGAVYEQYLGHVATIAKQRAQEAQARMNLGIATEPVFELTAKKQRRKEQGIYYTPKFVTDYIVKETVGRFIQEHNHHDIMSMKILDPACGSGSFLIRAYDELLRYHADQRGKSALELDQFERLPVLTGNIFGVDLDMQAVEIARLNLLLRSLARREILPTLKDNIRCGNSLISGTEKELEPYFGDGWQKKKPFNWETEFEKIMAGGGFDVIIGNPPYVEFKRLDGSIKNALESKFESTKGKYDIYVPFLEQGVRLLKPGGFLGYICPTMFMKRDYGKSLRSLLVSKCNLRVFVDFADNQIFGDAMNYVGIFIFQKMGIRVGECVCKVFKPDQGFSTEETAKFMLSEGGPDQPVENFIIDTTHLSEKAWTLANIDRFDLCTNLRHKVSTVLGDICSAIWEGIASGKDEVFYLDSKQVDTNKIEANLLHPLLRGKDVSRWSVLVNPPVRVLYPYDLISNKPIAEDELQHKYPNAYKYLLEKREQLGGRKYFDVSKKLWYELWCERQPKQFMAMKIITPEISNRNNFTLDLHNCFFNTKVYGLIKRQNVSENYKYLLGILNSTILEYYYQTFAPRKAGGFYAYKTAYLSDLPIRRVNFDNPAEKNMHDNLVILVDKMLELNKHLAPIRDTPCNERDELQRQIAHTDREIDSLVYDLYGLTDEERKVIEKSNSRTTND